MKKISSRPIAVLLMIILLFSSIGAVKTFANTDTQMSRDGFSASQELVVEDQSLIVEESADGVETRAVNSAITSGAVYKIKNAISGKYVNVHNGIDATGTNVYMWTGDGSAEQKFKIVYSSSENAYKFYCMCSQNGTFRVLDIKRDNAALASGQNVQICGPTDPTAQNWELISLGNDKYKICPSANTSLALTANGTSNGSSSGTSATSAGNVYISTYTGSSNQIWYLEQEGVTYATPSGCLDVVSDTTIAGWAWRSDLPNTPIDVHIVLHNTTIGQQWVISVPANSYRSDLAAAGIGNGYHTFGYTINWRNYPTGTYQVYAHGIGANGNNPQLSGSPKTFEIRGMEGSLDYLDKQHGIVGWAWRPDSPNSPISVHVYVYRTNGTQVAMYDIVANQYRSDLESSGYGNGYHGYSYAIPWSSLPEEILRVTAYYYDGTGYHPCFYDRYHDNRKDITLIGYTDIKGFDFSVWMTPTAIQNAYNIGTPMVNTWGGTDELGLVNSIRNSSYCVVSTHGNVTEIEWSIYANDPVNVQRDRLTTSDLLTLPDGYFNTTRCVLLDACLTGSGRENNPNNFVNTLHSKGVWTVVGFAEETKFFYYENTVNVIPDLGNKLWTSEFTKNLGNGYTVAQAANMAHQAVINASIGIDDDNNNIDDYLENNVYGLGSVYIAGDANQVVKH